MAKIYRSRRRSTIRNHNLVHEAYEKMKLEYGSVFTHLSKTFIYDELAALTLLHPKTVANILNLTKKED